MSDFNGEGVPSSADIPNLPPPITEESAAGMQAAAIILEHVDVSGDHVRGDHVIPDLQAAGFLGAGEFFTDTRQQALGALSARATYEDSLRGEKPREMAAKFERARNLQAAIIIIDHLDIVRHDAHGERMLNRLNAEGLLGATESFSDLHTRVFRTVAGIAALETVVVATDIDSIIDEEQAALAEASTETGYVASQ